jgi:hypothetical protein
MAIVSFLGTIVALVLIGVGIAFGAAAAVATVILCGLGILSSSVAIGFWRGRVESGLSAFFLMCGILAGIPAGMLCAWVVSTIAAGIDPGLLAVLGVGAAVGGASGAVVAVLLDFTARKLRAWLVARSPLQMGFRVLPHKQIVD